jgi:hypothetical protein
MASTSDTRPNCVWSTEYDLPYATFLQSVKFGICDSWNLRRANANRRSPHRTKHQTKRLRQMTNNDASTISDCASTAESLGTWLTSVNNAKHSPCESISWETTGASRTEASYWRNHHNLESTEEQEEDHQQQCTNQTASRRTAGYYLDSKLQDCMFRLFTMCYYFSLLRGVKDC